MQEIRRPLVMQLPEPVYRLSTAFKSAGFQLYVVGGAVRDAVMALEPKDFDLATNATPEQVAQIVMSMVPKWDTDLVGVAFGVIRARVASAEDKAAAREIIDVEMKKHSDAFKALCEYEIATFREDMTAGRHPTVRFATIVEDVARRDLTINALFYDIDRGEVVDLVGGLHDIERRIINTVGNPIDRFAEDRLRVLRAIRFASRFDYEIGRPTWQAIVDNNSLEGISPERIRDEFVKSVLTSPCIDIVIDSYDKLNMWGQVFTGLDVDASLNFRSNNVATLLACLLHKNNHTFLSSKLNELRYTIEEVRQVIALLNLDELTSDNAYRVRKLFDKACVSESQVREYVRDRQLPHVELIETFLKYRPTVSGDVLLAQGYSGKALGMEMERRETELFKGLLQVQETHRT